MKCLPIITLLLTAATSLHASPIDSNQNGVWDQFDVILDKLPSSELRVESRGLAQTVQDLIAAEPSDTESDLMAMALQHIVAVECVSMASVATGSTIRPEMVVYALISLAAEEHESAAFQSTMSRVQAIRTSPSFSTDRFDQSYNRMSPLKTETPACRTTPAPELPF